MKQIEETLAIKEIYDGRILSLHVDDIKLPNGHESIRECVDHKNGAAILAVEDGFIYFVKQYRYAIKNTILEIPAGLVEKGENPQETAIRELQEEIGLYPEQIIHLVDVYPSPGFTNELTSIFYANKFKKQRLIPDDDEFIEIIKLPVEQVKEDYKAGKFLDAKTVCALGYYFSHST